MAEHDLNKGNAQNPAETKVEVDPKTLIVVEKSSDFMKVYVKLMKPEEGEFVPTKELVLEAIEADGVVYGVDETLVEKLVERPIYNLKIPVGSGLEAQNGEDGHIDFFVVRDDEYKPELKEEDGDVNFKDLDYFQIVKAGDMLCAITPPGKGENGKDVLGREIVAKEGREAKSPQGKNTSFSEDGGVLFADCDGIVNFTKDVVNINDVLKIKENVDTNTGNIDFSGDVIIEGDVCEGFSVKSGGNVMVKGVVEGANIDAAGNVQIVNGIIGEKDSCITVGGNLRCLYIQDAIVDVKGDITAESIIESKITCGGDVDLTVSGAGLLVGGTVTLEKDLKAKTLGNENERVTNIKIEGIKTDKGIEKKAAIARKDELIANIEKLKKKKKDLLHVSEEMQAQARQQISAIDAYVAENQGVVDQLNKKIQELSTQWAVEYKGCVTCTGKMFYGTRIYFGEEKFQFNDDYLIKSRVCWQEGEIININL